MNITNLEMQTYLEAISEPRKSEIMTLCDMMEKVTQKKPKLWGSIIGFGSLHYTYKTGHEGDMPILGLANRKQAITLYMSYNIEQYNELIDLGKVTHGKGCLYIKKLSDVNLSVLESLMKQCVKDLMQSPLIKENEESHE